MIFRKYTGEEFKTLLKAIDAHLDVEVEIILIGWCGRPSCIQSNALHTIHRDNVTYL